MKTLRIATYNIHKCVGMDRRLSPERIVDVLREIDADVIALQEVVSHSGRHARDNQAEFIAGSLKMGFRSGHNRLIAGADYGNVVLSRFPIGEHENYDISIGRYEPRGCLRTEISLNGSASLHFMNIHMGTSFFERRKQVHRLLSAGVIDRPEIIGRRIVAGDFNEWISGVTTRLFKTNFRSIDPRLHLGRARTFPGLLPMLHLDHVYFDDRFKLKNAVLHRSKTALIASDHLPIYADFEF